MFTFSLHLGSLAPWPAFNDAGVASRRPRARVSAPCGLGGKAAGRDPDPMRDSYPVALHVAVRWPRSPAAYAFNLDEGAGRERIVTQWLRAQQRDETVTGRAALEARWPC
jgi:hypothetical protein